MKVNFEKNEPARTRTLLYVGLCLLRCLLTHTRFIVRNTEHTAIADFFLLFKEIFSKVFQNAYLCVCVFSACMSACCVQECVEIKYERMIYAWGH